MSVYSVDKLMAETRRLAAEYHRTTNQSLPVTSELAKYDAMRLLNLAETQELIAGVDAVDTEQQLVQIKGRALFNEERQGSYRIGQLNPDGEWDRVVLVLMDAEYNAIEICGINRPDLLDGLNENQNEKRKKRGAMSVAKFRAISQLLWAAD